MTELELRGVSVEYVMKRTQMPVQAVRDVSFNVPTGSFATIVGPSGCGKTTILNVVCGLTPTTVGRVLLDGESLTGPGKDRALVFQSPSLMPWRTVVHNVTFGLEIEGVPPSEARERARHYVRLLGLEGFEESYPSEVSEGMRQRVNLARALATEPKLLLLDEPFAALDAQTREYMQVELESIWRLTGKTALLVTHNISEAIFLGDCVIVLSARPGMVKAILQVDFPRPRPLHVKRSPAFNEIEDRVWRMLQDEASSTGMIVRTTEGGG